MLALSQATRVSRLRAFFQRLKYGSRQAKDFGVAVAYTGGKRVARTMDQGLYYGLKGLNKGVNAYNQGVWKVVNKLPLSDKGKKAVHATGVISGLVGVPVFTAGSIQLARKDRGYTNKEQRIRKGPVLTQVADLSMAAAYGLGRQAAIMTSNNPTVGMNIPTTVDMLTARRDARLKKVLRVKKLPDERIRYAAHREAKNLLKQKRAV